MNKKQIIISLGIVLFGITPNIEAQNVTAYRGTVSTVYSYSNLVTATASTSGNLANVDSIVVTGEWSNAQLFTLNRALRSNWPINVIPTNDILKKADFSAASFTGGGSSTDYSLGGAFQNHTALTKLILPESNFDASISFRGVFRGCSQLTEVINLDRFSNITDLTFAFYDCLSLQKVTFSTTINANAVSFSYTFWECHQLTEVNNLDRFSKITDMNHTFYNCFLLKNITFSTVANANAVVFDSAFGNCTQLTEVNNLDRFSNITDLSDAFTECRLLSSLTFSTTTNTNKVSFDSTFSGCTQLTEVNNLDRFSNITNLFRTFYKCTSLTSITFSTAANANAINLFYMCFRCKQLTEVKNLDRFSNITNLDHAFTSCEILSSLTFSTVENTNKIDLGGAFSLCYQLMKVENLNKFSNITKLKATFSGCTALPSITFSTTANANSIECDYLFENCNRLIEVKNFDRFNNITTLLAAFYLCKALPSITFSTTANANAIDFAKMCYGCEQLTEVKNLDRFSNITNLQEAFYLCKSLRSVTFSPNVNSNKVKFSYTFYGCEQLTKVENLNQFSNISQILYTFYRCKSLLNIDFAAVENKNGCLFYAAFQDCEHLSSINNLNKFGRFSLHAIFANCKALQQVRLSTDPNDIPENHTDSTFTGTNLACIKYLPSNVTDIPQNWKDAGYANFVLPITIDTLNDVSIDGKNRIAVSDIPVIISDFCYRTDTLWQTCANNTFASAITEYAMEDVIPLTENGKYLRLAVKSLNPDASGADIYYYSNVVNITKKTSTDIGQTTTPNATIYAENRRIICSDPFEIYTISGVNVTNDNGGLPYGVYVIRTEKTTQKILVK